MDQSKDYNSWKVDDLKSELERRNLSTSGRKINLVQRLIINDKENANVRRLADKQIDPLKITVAKLRQELKSRGLPTAGVKSELIKRLNSSIANPINTKSSVSGTHDTNILVLLNLRYDDVMRACNTSKEMATVCRDDNFWKQMVDRDFHVTHLKPENITYRQQYMDVRATDSTDREELYKVASDALYYGRIDILERLYNIEYNFNANPYYLVADEMAPLGQFDFEIGFNNNIDVLDWLMAHDISKKKYWGTTIEVLEYLESKDKINYSGALWDIAARGSIDAVHWLEDKGVVFHGYHVTRALGNGRFDILDWLIDRGTISDDIVRGAIRGWLQVPLLPTGDKWVSEPEREKEKEDTLIVTEWAGKRGLLTDAIGGEAFKILGMTVMPLLLKYNVLPDSDAADGLMRQNKFEMVKYLASLGVYPTHVGADIAAARGNLGMLELCYRAGVLPTSVGADYAARNGNLDVIRWLLQYGIKPTESGLRRMRDSDREYVIDLINKYKL